MSVTPCERNNNNAILNAKFHICRKASEHSERKSLAISPLRGGDLDLAVVNLLLQILGVLAVDGAADADAGAEDLLDGAGELLGHGPGLHDLGDLDDVVEADVARVLDVLDLLAVSLGLLERLDDERRGGGHHRDLGLTVLHRELDGDAEALPVFGRLLGDVLTDLLGGETERSDLGGQRRRRTDLTARHADEHLHHLRRVELWRHGCWCSGGRWRRARRESLGALVAA
jgi:hypothetical protein